MIDASRFDVRWFEECRAELKREFDQSYKSQFREIFDHFRPRRGFYVRDDVRNTNGGKVHGGKVNEKVVNSTTLRVSKNAQSGLQAGVTSPSRPWKKLGPPTSDLKKMPGVNEFFDETDRRMDYVLSKSNFYRATHTAYGDFVDVGVAALQIDEHETDVIRCQVHPIGSWFGATNADGKVDVFYRDYNPTGHELLSQFSIDELPEKLHADIKRAPFKRFEIRNAIEPNPFFRDDIPVIGIAAFKYISVWWCKGYDKKFIRVHGYHEFPVMVFRMAKSENGDAYGYGAGQDALPDAKQLMFLEDQKCEAVDKMVTPPMQAPTALRMGGGVSLVRGKVTYHDGPGKIESLYNVNLPIQYVQADIEIIQQRLSEHFFEDLFLMITQSVQRQTTAREIEERHEEKLIMLGPVLESINDELLDPAIDRIIGVMRRSGLLPQAPPSLSGLDFKVEYISILAQAQRAIQTIAIEQGVNFVSATAQAGWIEALDKLNVDTTIDEYWDRIGFPAKAARGEAEIVQIRDARNQKQSQADQLAMAGEAAKVAQAGAAAASQQIQPSILNALLAGAA